MSHHIQVSSHLMSSREISLKILKRAKQFGMTLVYYSYEVHTNSIGTLQITSLLCLKKGVQDGLSGNESIEFSLPDLNT